MRYRALEDATDFLEGESAYLEGKERDDTQSLMWVAGWDEAERLEQK